MARATETALTAAIAERHQLDDKLCQRRREILAADQEYQTIFAAYSTAKALVDKLLRQLREEEGR